MDTLKLGKNVWCAQLMSGKPTPDLRHGTVSQFFAEHHWQVTIFGLGGYNDSTSCGQQNTAR
jgi:hypothetical protein